MTAQSLVKCPECGGTGQYGVRLLKCHATGRAEIAHGACAVCRGSGRVTYQRLEWLGEGRRIQRHRTAQKLSLNEFALMHGISPRDLNEIEHGRADPSSLSVAISAAPLP
jgi:DNA-binding XRE family transcriptional regulator